MHDQILISLGHLVQQMKRIADAYEKDHAGSKPSAGAITKHDLQRMEDRIMAKLEDLVSAATALSTASDGLSVKVDNLVTKLDAFLAAIKNADLPTEAENALAGLRASRDLVVKAGDSVDAEVAKVDTALPTPAPAGPGG